MKMIISSPTSLYDFFTDPKFVSSVDKFNCIQTAVLRYYLTAYTGKRLKNERLNQSVINKQIKKLKKIEVNSNFDMSVHLELIKKGGEMYGKNKTQMKSHVSYGKRFFDFVSLSITPVQEKSEDNKDAILPYKEAIMDKSEFIGKAKSANKKVTLKNDPDLYLAELKIKYPNLDKKELYKKAQSSLKNIFEVINSFIENRKKKRSKATLTEYKNLILRFLGWYKKYYELSINQVIIGQIIPIVNPYIRYEIDELSDENFSKIAIQEWHLKRKVKDKSKKFMAVLNKFLNGYLKNAAIGTKKMYIQSLIDFCYFLYKDITDVEENSDFQDISLINRLHVCMRDLNKNKEIEEDKIIPFNWTEIEMVCERLRKEANQDFTYRKASKNNKGKKLTKRQKALRIQDFLAIAFFCVMPPDRQRTFRELTFGETLKYGIRDVERNTFTSYEKLKEGEKAKYYINLLPHQYKTGKTYKTYWHEINNVEYEDGRKFYDYLNQWFFEGYRDELATAEKTNAVFIRKNKGDSFDKDERSSTYFAGFIQSIFKRKTKFPLNPHALRDIYVTHINNLNLPEETRRAIAYMMHHDLDTANKTYNKQTMDEKIALGVDFVNRANPVSTTDTSSLTAIAS